MNSAVGVVTAVDWTAEESWVDPQLTGSEPTQFSIPWVLVGGGFLPGDKGTGA
jgi:hypothetical protein